VRPRRLPDLYPGEAVVLAVRGNLPDQLQLAGRIGDSPWQARVPLALAPDGVGVAKLWARRAVEDLQVRQRAGGDSAALGDEMLAVALEHQIVSPVTSLVAVQATPIRAAGDAAPERAVPGMVPHGMTMGLNGLPATATGAQLRWLLALLLAIAGVVLFYAATRPPRGAPRSV
jgi:Ca-activated chloride channel family protein